MSSFQSLYYWPGRAASYERTLMPDFLSSCHKQLRRISWYGYYHASASINQQPQRKSCSQPVQRGFSSETVGQHQKHVQLLARTCPRDNGCHHRSKSAGAAYFPGLYKPSTCISFHSKRQPESWPYFQSMKIARWLVNHRRSRTS